MPLPADPMVGSLEDDISALEGARDTLSRAGDEIGVGLCESALGFRLWAACRAEDAHLAYRRAHEAHRRAGGATARRRMIGALVASAVMSGTHVEGIRRMIDELRDEAVDPGPLLAATLRGAQARMDFVRGAIGFDEMRAACDEEIALLEQTGFLLQAALPRNFALIVAPRMVGDLEAAEAGAQVGVAETERVGARFYLANQLGVWASILCERGDPAGALEIVGRARAIAAADDVADQISLDSAEAWARTLQGEHEVAVQLVERARRTARGIQMALVTDEIDETDAVLHASSGDVDGARRLYEGMIARADGRGAVRWAERHRRKLAELG
jgi:hypothetical protein